MMRLFIVSLLMIFGTQAWAECDKFCVENWWKTATTSDVKAELNVGADVMARSKYGYTPLHFAAEDGTPQSIQVLLEAGADLMARNSMGWTPLHIAAAPATPKNIQAFLKAGADAKAKNRDDKTP